ncbi:hypothetical protein AOLI_G00249900 [Acnodon oligacanthus]
MAAPHHPTSRVSHRDDPHNSEQSLWAVQSPSLSTVRAPSPLSGQVLWHTYTFSAYPALGVLSFSASGGQLSSSSGMKATMPGSHNPLPWLLH